MNIHDLESQRKCEEAMKMNFKDELKAWGELAIALAILIMAIGFIYTMSKIPKELRGGIYKSINDHYYAINDRANKLEANFDKHMRELDKREEKQYNKLEALCNQIKLQDMNITDSSRQIQTGRPSGYAYSSQ